MEDGVDDELGRVQQRQQLQKQRGCGKREHGSSGSGQRNAAVALDQQCADDGHECDPDRERRCAVQVRTVGRWARGERNGLRDGEQHRGSDDSGQRQAEKREGRAEDAA